MPLERRRTQRLKAVKEESDEDDTDAESANNLMSLFGEDEESNDKDKESPLDNDASSYDQNKTSSAAQHSTDTETTLESFRHEWKNELNSKNKTGKSKHSRPESITTRTSLKSHNEEDKLRKASSLFLEGVELERHGEVNDAVDRYMAAVRLVPDIEIRIFMNRNSTRGTNTNSPDSSGRVRSRSRSTPITDGGYEENTDLEGTLQKRIAERGTLIEPDICGNPCPIARLPSELLMTIVKYVVGSELDVRCLEMLSQTSAAFYLLSRDEELWRIICRRVFGEHRISSENDNDSSLNGCWRLMYTSQPHVYLHGVYIGKCTYIHHGEASFQDQFYRPWHIVVYYRFMKFFADGTVLMVTSSEKPAQIVSQLKSKSTHLSGVLFGRYRLIDHDRIAAQFFRHCERSEQKTRRYQRLRQQFVPHEVSLQEFNVELRFGDGKRRSAHCVLQWEKYDCSFRYLNGQISESSLDVGDHQLFPPLFFSRVKSFAQPDGWDEVLV